MHIKVMLEYFYPWTNSAGIYLARERGWYQKEGLDIECVVYDPARGDSLAYLARGEVDFALFPSNRLFVQREMGKPVRGVAAINHCGLEVIQTITQTGIRRPRDLTGKRVALHPTPRGLAMVRHIVKQDGGDPEKINIVDSGVRELMPEDIAAGVADATFGSYWAWEVLMESLVPQSERLIWPVQTIGAPSYHSYLLGTSDRLIADHPKVVQTFLQITKQGYEAVAKQPLIAAPIYERMIPYFSSQLIERSLPVIATTWLYQGRWGKLREELLAPYAQWLKNHGILRDSMVWREAIDSRFLSSL